MINQKNVHILWTGGLDSTARMVELSRKPIVIHPYYVIDQGRASTSFEMDAMRRIRERLLCDPNTIAEILPITEIIRDEIHPDSVISTSWQKLNEKYGLGTQYDFLARYAKANNIVLELGVEKEEGSRARASILSEGEMIEIEDFSGCNYKISEIESSSDALAVWRFFTFPLWEKSKLDAVQMMEDLGCGDIVEMTWFCHNPLLGKPCGHCNPCVDARHYGFSWRIPKSRFFLWYLCRPRIALKTMIDAVLR